MDQKQCIIDKYNRFLYNSDIDRYKNSSFLQIYPEISLQRGTQNYLYLNLPLKSHRIIAQLRLLNKFSRILCIDFIFYEINDKIYCYRSCKNNTLLHMLIDRENFIKKREDLMLPITDNGNLDFFKIVEEPTLKNVKKFIALIKHVLYMYNTNMY